MKKESHLKIGLLHVVETKILLKERKYNMKLMKEINGKMVEIELTPVEMAMVDKELKINFMAQTAIDDFDIDEKDAREVAENAYEYYASGKYETTEWQAVQHAVEEFEKEKAKEDLPEWEIEYYETYFSSYKIKAATREKAKRILLEGIESGKYDGPMTCEDSGCR